MLVHKLSEPLECQGSKYRHHTLDTEHHSPLTRLIFSLGWYNCGNGDHTISLSSSHPAGFRTSANITYRSALVLSEGKRKRCCVTGSEVTCSRQGATVPYLASKVRRWGTGGVAWNNGKEVPRWGCLLRYRKWVPQQLGDVNKQESGDSRPMGARHSDMAANLLSGCGQTCVFGPGLVELVRSNLGTSFPLFHGA